MTNWQLNGNGKKKERDWLIIAKRGKKEVKRHEILI